jgi:hypothetical protein
MSPRWSRLLSSLKLHFQAHVWLCFSIQLTSGNLISQAVLPHRMAVVVLPAQSLCLKQSFPSPSINHHCLCPVTPFSNKMKNYYCFFLLFCLSNLPCIVSGYVNIHTETYTNTYVLGMNFKLYVYILDILY